MALFGKTERSQLKEQESFTNPENKKKTLSNGSKNGSKKIDKMQNNLKTLQEKIKDLQNKLSKVDVSTEEHSKIS